MGKLLEGKFGNQSRDRAGKIPEAPFNRTARFHELFPALDMDRYVKLRLDLAQLATTEARLIPENLAQAPSELLQSTNYDLTKRINECLDEDLRRDPALYLAIVEEMIRRVENKKSGA
jgi:hypothetical protein